MDVTYPPAMIQDTIQALVDFFDGKGVPLDNTQSAQCVTADNVEMCIRDSLKSNQEGNVWVDMYFRDQTISTEHF